MPRTPHVSSDTLTLQMQSSGIVSAQQLATALGVDRSTVSRGLAGLGNAVLRMGAARSARYALRRSVRNLGRRWPLYRIDVNGQAQQFGELQALHGGFFWETEGESPTWLRHGYANGVFPGLPFFLSDVRPQGFMGRSLAHAISASLGVPADPRNWQDDDTLAYLLAHGDDLPGDCVVGESMVEQALRRTEPVPAGIHEDTRPEHYMALANTAMAGGPVGSSAEGEQPKFTTHIYTAQGVRRSVLVKFSSPLATAAGRRWADLLAAEHHALTVLSAHGMESAPTVLLDAGDRRFLEVTRFDRVGAQGRRGLLTLRAVESGLLEETATDWPSVGRGMATAGLLAATDAAALRLRWCFGQLIGNTDMHLGNASVWFGDEEPFRLAPVYDMLPMLFAPGAQGEIVPREFVVPPALPALREGRAEAAPWAREFWGRVEADERISAEFRALAAVAGTRVGLAT